MKTAIQQAAKLYEDKGLNLAKDLEYYLKYGYVFCTPDKLLLAREIKKDDNGESWVLPGTGDTWFVHFAIGKDSIKWFIDQAPSPRKWVAWARQFKMPARDIRYYDFQRLKLKFS